MTRRILSLAIAVIATLAGYFALWSGGYAILRNLFQYGAVPTVDFGALALVVLGLVLLAVAVLTIALSSVGAIVVGTVHLLFGVVTIVLPVEIVNRSFPPTYQLINALFDPDSAISNGFYFSVPTGFGMLAGVIFLVAGLAARGRTAIPSAVGRVVSLVVAFLLGPAAVLVTIMGGMLIYRDQLQRVTGEVNGLGVGLILVGVIVLAGVLFTVRWSSAGVIVLGGVVTVIAVVALVQPTFLGKVFGVLSRDLANALDYASSNGNLALVGVLLLAAGVGARMRGRRRALAGMSEPAAAASF